MPVTIHRIDSQVLRGNPLGDPTARDLYVYTPPGWDAERGPRLPALLGIAGFTGSGATMFNVDPLVEALPAKFDRLIANGSPPFIVAAPDCFTRVGGNQYINSAATGRYEDYLLDEVMPFVDRTYRPSRWGVFGKSSGGYGAMLLGMRHPDRFLALADHSGDAGFELCYIPDFGGALGAYREAGGPAKWLDKFWGDENHRRKQHFQALNIMGMAAHYSPSPEHELGIEFPFDLATGEFRWDVWQRWRAWDPINLAADHAEALKKLRGVWIDCGTKDEFNLIWGNRALATKLRAHGVAVTFEEFEDGHSSITYRYDRSLPFLAKALG